jgi:ABC-type transport system involved in cytochrome c biogenesis permease subunit
MTKLNLNAPFAFAVLVVTAASIEPAAALIEPARALHLIEPAAAAPVPAPLIGAGLPALAILAGGYWLVRKFREHS